jgi:signal transduction histidine kinase
LAQDIGSFRKQEVTFAALNLFLLAALLLTDLSLSPFLGKPPQVLFVVLSAGLVCNAADLIWVSTRKSISPESMVAVTWVMIALNVAAAFALASISYRQDVQYFALMIVPILRAAFRFSLGATILTVAASITLIFFWVWNYFRVHTGFYVGEYLEAGTISLIFAICALLVWTLVNHLRSKQEELSKNLAELEEAKAKLLIEEKLAAVGRFSSAIAHEIRNPVAMILSALTTASNLQVGSAESREMFEIAASEAARLERLTTDFLNYARPRMPSKQRSDVSDSIAYIADICRPRAVEARVGVRNEGPEGLWAMVDSGQLQQALLNLAVNAIEASPPDATVVLRGCRDQASIRIEVENASGPIETQTAARIFEPFFTTKPTGTGLGLAIARSFALAHDGDLILSRNQPNFVQFSIVLPAEGHKEAAHA